MVARILQRHLGVLDFTNGLSQRDLTVNFRAPEGEWMLLMRILDGPMARPGMARLP